MLKHWRILLLIIVVLASVFAVGMKVYPHGRNGVQIAYISDTSPANGILETGDVITEINNIDVKNVEDWNNAIRNTTSFYMIVNGEEYNFQTNDTLGINVLEIDRTNLDFGLDIKGGTRVILKPEAENLTSQLIEQVIGTLQTRANLFGLREISIKELSDIQGNVFIQIEASGIGSDVINNLLTKTGKFEGKITKPVVVKDNKAILLLGDTPEDRYELTLENQTLIIDDQRIEINDTFLFDGIQFQYLSSNPDQLILLADVYDSKDVELIFSDAQRSGIQRAGTVSSQGSAEGYNFFFTILISSKGAEKFRKVTSGIPSQLTSGGEYLKDSELLLYLDGRLITNLRIASSLGGQAYTTPQITGFRETRDDARKEMLLLQSVLRSGQIPVKLEIISTDIISPILGATFLSSVGLIAILGAFTVFFIVLIRYRRIKIALPLILISLTEVIIILGIASINDSIIWGAALFLNLILLGASWWKKNSVDVFAWIGALSIPLLGMAMSWTIDLPAIGGIIAAIGTGVDHQIIIADEAIGRKIKKILSIKEKIKTAFFIIFGAAATTIFAMLPLMFLVAEFVRGFAITTIIGVWIGITITRPAYARIIETLTNKETGEA